MHRSAAYLHAMISSSSGFRRGSSGDARQGYPPV